MNEIILRSPEMALRLAEILFAETQAPRKLEWFEPLGVEDHNHFDLAAHPVRNMRAELANGIWHVYGQTGSRSAELVFRRSNAQVIVLDARPVE